MSRPITIILPIFPFDSKNVYFKGYVASSERKLTLCITKFGNNIESLKKYNDRSKNTIYGFCGETVKKLNEVTNYVNWLSLHRKQGLNVNQLIIDDKMIHSIDDCIIILYDHEKILNSEAIGECGDFIELKDMVQRDYGISPDVTKYDPILKIPCWLSSSMFIQHILNYMNVLYWLMVSIKRDKKVSTICIFPYSAKTILLHLSVYL